MNSLTLIDNLHIMTLDWSGVDSLLYTLMWSTSWLMREHSQFIMKGIMWCITDCSIMSADRPAFLRVLLLNCVHMGVCQEGLGLRWSFRLVDTPYHRAVSFAVPSEGILDWEYGTEERERAAFAWPWPSHKRFMSIKEMNYRGCPWMPISSHTLSYAFCEFQCIQAKRAFNQSINAFPSQFATSGNVNTENNMLFIWLNVSLTNSLFYVIKTMNTL